MERNNELIEWQKMLKDQAHRLMDAIQGEVKVEVARSGALSQNAQAYLKSVATSLRVKEMTNKNPQAEDTILKEIGVLNEE